MLYYIVLVPMVYVAFATFFIGTAVRLIKIFREPRHPATLQIFPEKKPRWLWALLDTFFLPTVRKHKPLLWVFLIAFHICILLLIIGHLELFAEIETLQFIPHEIFLGRGLVGVIACIALFFISAVSLAGAGTFGSGRLLSVDFAVSGGFIRQRDGLGPQVVLL
jgi:nitrate reductase gamma subunit